MLPNGQAKVTLIGASHLASLNEMSLSLVIAIDYCQTSVEVIDDDFLSIYLSRSCLMSMTN